MTINSKQKGKTGELELAKILREYGFDTRRTVQYNGRALEGNADIVGLPGIHAEVKRVEKLNIDKAMEQAIRDSNTLEMPTVFHRRNRKQWLVTMRLADWVSLLNAKLIHDGLMGDKE